MITGNTTVQSNRSLTLTLSAVSGAWLIDTAATGTILDDA